MIQLETILKVADNSGAKTVRCIKVLGKKRIGHVGDTLIVSVRSLRSRLRDRKVGVEKGQIYKALIIRTKKTIKKRGYGLSLAFESNDVVLLNTQNDLVGTRIFGPIARELRERGYTKILSQSKRIL